MTNSADSWSCVISLRFDYDSKGIPLHRSRRIDFGPVILDKSEVEIWLRRAQTAILNPDRAREDFLYKTEQELRGMPNKLKFSKNAVCMHIKDPDATDLSFVDLPGKSDLILAAPRIRSDVAPLFRSDPKRSSRIN
jgi:vacuolar protein sorting-associated protein 1